MNLWPVTSFTYGHAVLVDNLDVLIQQKLLWIINDDNSHAGALISAVNKPVETQKKYKEEVGRRPLT